jgi:flotillin
MLSIIIPIGIGLLVIAAIAAFLCTIYKVADVDKALIITGGKEPVIKVSGGSFVIPIFRKAQYFDLCMLTVPADSDEIKTKTSVPIVVDWTAQIRPNTKDMSILQKAIVSFKERGNDGIIDDVRLTLMGAVRGVVATLTPEEVQNNKEKFKEEIMKSVSDELDEMGLELVSLNIQDITDNNGYYDDIAAHDREDKRKEAAKVKASADQQIRQQNAESEKIAAAKELETELAIAEKKRDNDLQKAAFKAETDKANADADVAGELQKTVRQQEIAEQEGRVEVIKQEQANLAAIKNKEVVVTQAQAEKEKVQIAAEASANTKKIEADAEVLVAERAAKAVKITAEATAEQITKEGLAQAEIVKQKGLAEVEVAKQKALAEAEGEKARLLAKAEGERALAEARASNDKVNFEIEKIRLDQEARITIATKTAEIMAELGKNAEFVNIGGAAQGAGTGNVLLDTLAGIPSLMKTLNVENNALNGKSFNEEVQDLVGSIAGPLKGLLVNNGEAPLIPEETTSK